MIHLCLRQHVIAALSDELRRPQYQGDPNPYRGHCYVASEAYYHLRKKYQGRIYGDAPATALKPHTVRVGGDVHWFLRDQDGAVVDLTCGQFWDPVPYHLGRGRGFLTKKPSKRAAVVIERVENSIEHELLGWSWSK